MSGGKPVRPSRALRGLLLALLALVSAACCCDDPCAPRGAAGAAVAGRGIPLPPTPFKRFRLEDDQFDTVTGTLNDAPDGTGVSTSLTIAKRMVAGTVDCDDSASTADNTQFGQGDWESTSSGGSNQAGFRLQVTKGGFTYLGGWWNWDPNKIRAVCVTNPRTSGNDYLVDVTPIVFVCGTSSCTLRVDATAVQTLTRQ
jgi:hypothetical protein